MRHSPFHSPAGIADHWRNVDVSHCNTGQCSLSWFFQHASVLQSARHECFRPCSCGSSSLPGRVIITITALTHAANQSVLLQ